MEPMVAYRLYRLHGPRNEVESFEEFEVADDAGAIAKGLTLRGVNAMELWSGHRKVYRWEALGAPHDS
jgi:hypothetical protein